MKRLIYLILTLMLLSACGPNNVLSASDNDAIDVNNTEAMSTDAPEIAPTDSQPEVVASPYEALQVGKFSDLYLGQIPPGDVPEVFAPGIVSMESSIEFAIAISPDGMEMFISRRQLGAGAVNHLFYTSFVDGSWSEPELSPVSTEYGESEANYSPDGNTLFFMSRRPVPDDVNSDTQINYWVSTRTETGWSEPVHFGSNMMFLTQANSGNVYFTDIGGNRGFISMKTYVDGAFLEREDVEYPGTSTREQHAHPFIAPDESYLIFDALDDLYIIFKLEDGSWSSLHNLGEAINTRGSNEGISMVTADGKYFFFSRGGNYDEDIYWVSAAFIEELKAEVLGE